MDGVAEHPALEMLRGRIDYWRQVMWPAGLRHWIINVEIVEEPSGRPNSAAAVRSQDSYDLAEIQFSRELMDDYSDTEIDRVIVHELLHIVFRDLDEAISSVETWMPAATYTDFNERIDHEEEGIIDRLARSIVEAHSASWRSVVQSTKHATLKER